MTTNEPVTTPQFLAALIPVIVDAVVIVILISWAVSATKKAWRGEEVSLTEIGIARGG